MAMIQSFPTGSGNGTSKISQKLGNAATNITGSINPTEDGLYVEDLSTIVNSISLSQKTAELMNKPNTWVVGQEYDFGDGVYGQRFTGSVTHTATHTTQDVVLTSTIPDSLISSGGKWNRGSTYWTLSIGQITPVATSTSGDIDLLSVIAIDYTRGLLVRFYNNVAQTSTYDIWVKYTK